jgi:hypothetical protein
LNQLKNSFRFNSIHFSNLNLYLEFIQSKMLFIFFNVFFIFNRIFSISNWIFVWRVFNFDACIIYSYNSSASSSTFVLNPDSDLVFHLILALIIILPLILDYFLYLFNIFIKFFIIIEQLILLLTFFSIQSLCYFSFSSF